MTITYLGLGGNLGNTIQILRDTIVYLAQYPEITLRNKASIYLSSPLDTTGPDFLNTVVCIQTTYSVTQLHAICIEIEHQFERKRPYHYAPRTLDIDLLLFGEQSFALPTLTIPHPRMTDRAFVLLPLAEIAPDIMIPGRGKISQFLSGVAQQAIKKIVLNNCPSESIQ